MKRKQRSEEDQAPFRQLMAGTRKIKQDTIVHRPQRKKIRNGVPVKRLIQRRPMPAIIFSDEFQPLLNTEGQSKYVRLDVSHFERRSGDAIIHRNCFGFTRSDAAAGKQELGALIAACRRGTCVLCLRDAWAREAYFETATPLVAGNIRM